MRQQILRQDVDERHRQQCEQKLQVLTDQRDDLVAEIDQLGMTCFLAENF
jgi:cell division protein FtsB